MIMVSGYRCNNDQDSSSEDNVNFLAVNSCGYEIYKTKNIKTLREKGRNDYQILYIARGSGSFNVDGHMTDLPCGSIIVFRPGEMQQYAYLCQNKPEIYWIHFTGYGAEKVIKKVGLADGRTFYTGLQERYIEYFRKIILELQLKSNLYEYAADAELLELLTYMGRKLLNAGSTHASDKDASIQKLLERMHTDYSLHWTIEDMAKMCNLSSDRFMHKFREQVGQPAMEYLLKIRIDKAKVLLIDSSLSIKEISNVIGYENPLYFSRLFKRMEGVSPNNYKCGTGTNTPCC